MALQAEGESKGERLEGKTTREIRAPRKSL